MFPENLSLLATCFIFRILMYSVLMSPCLLSFDKSGHIITFHYLPYPLLRFGGFLFSSQLPGFSLLHPPASLASSSVQTKI